MAKRFIDTGLFRKPSIRAMKAPYKALFIYLLCECDHAGVWDVELDVAETRLGIKLDPAKAIAELGGAVMELDGGARWWLVDFVEFQYGDLNPSNRVHASVLNRLSSLGIDPKNKPLTSPLEGAKDKDKDKDKDKEGVKGEPPTPNPFDAFWSAYPIKKAKGAALKAWSKLTAQERAQCLPAIQVQVAAKHFRGKDGTDFIPHPATWLNARRWEDEVTSGDRPTPRATGWLIPGKDDADKDKPTPMATGWQTANRA